MLRLLVLLAPAWAQITAPSSCSITQSSFSVSSPELESVSVTSNEKRVNFQLQVSFTATCTSSTGDTSWVSASGERMYYARGIDSLNSKTGTTYYGIEVKDSQDNNAFQYGERWESGPCVSEEYKGTWTADGGNTVCDSTSGSISGTDCINLFKAVEASICWQVSSPKVCKDTKVASGTLSAYASLHLVAENSKVTSTPAQVLDLSSYYSCSGDEADVKESFAVLSAASSASVSFLLMLVWLHVH
ncbi:unnamed protein product [Effrenium voratum]|nr:unnamed protein product [Effrenium voratum]